MSNRIPSNAMARPESLATMTEYGIAGAINSRGARQAAAPVPFELFRSRTKQSDAIDTAGRNFHGSRV